MIQELRRFAATCFRYVSARLRLARLEGKEAAGHLLKTLILVALTLGVAAFGWLFLCLGLASWLATLFQAHGWVWSLLILAAAHLLLVFALVSAIKGQARTPLFPLTTEELKKDQEWLDQTSTRRP